MKTPDKTKTSKKVVNLDLDALDRVVANARTVTTGADVVPPRRSQRRKREKPRGRPPAQGYTRSSFDLPTELHDRFKLAAVQRKQSMRDLVEEALRAHLKL